ncbi:hypothetical protein [Thermovenabulum sp.]|uniref:hypothetical protein n=1 Tax=Thermovenabulum sp. TaxID=3100335 RepID=UPI003C7AD710
MNRIKNTLTRALIIVFSGLMISTTFLINDKTAAWFTSRAEYSFQVQAASEEDIIEELFTTSGGKKTNLNPDTIIVKKAKDMKPNFIIYFTLEDENKKSKTGRITDYILHINPLEIDNNGQIKIPIKLKFNYRDLVYLWNNYDGTTKGIITLKYLNGFIVKEYPVEFENSFLWAKAAAMLTGAEEKSYDKNKKYDLEKQMKEHTAKIIEEIAGNIRWQEIAESPRVERFTKDTINPFEKIQLEEEQKNIIDIIVPGLREYIERMYNYIEKIVINLNEKNAEIEKQNMIIEEMLRENAKLQKEKEELFKEKQELEKQNAELKEEIERLEKRIEGLESVNERLAEENRKKDEEKNQLQQQMQEIIKEAEQGGNTKEVSDEEGTIKIPEEGNGENESESIASEENSSINQNNEINADTKTPQQIITEMSSETKNTTLDTNENNSGTGITNDNAVESSTQINENKN